MIQPGIIGLALMTNHTMLELLCLQVLLKKWSQGKRHLAQQIHSIHNELEAMQSAPTHLQDHVMEAKLINRYDSTMTKLN